MLLFACAQILGGYIYDTVGIDIEGNFDLRYAAHCGRDTVQSELAEALVVPCEFTLTLENVDINSGLVVRRGGEYLALLGGDGCISLDQRGRNAAHGLDGKGQRGNIQQKDIARAGIACQLAALDARADGNALVGVKGLAGLMACQLLYLILYAGDTGGSADQEDFIQIGVAQARVLHGVPYGNRGLLYQIGDQLFEFGPCQVHIKVLGTFCGSGDERQVDVGGCRAGQLLLGLLRRLFQSLQSHLVIGQVYAFLCLELFDHPVDDSLVEVIAAQVGITVGGKNFDDAVRDLDDGYIEGTAAQVIDHDLLFFFIVEAIGKGCRCRLVDDTLYFQARDPARVLGRLTLRVIEISGNCDDRFCDLLAQIVFRVRFQLLQDHG